MPKTRYKCWVKNASVLDRVFMDNVYHKHQSSKYKPLDLDLYDNYGVDFTYG